MHPFTDNSAENLSTLDEEKLIANIRRWLGPVTPPAPYGIGDDCAILPPSKHPQAITVDPVIHGRHFDDTVPPRAVGAKLLKRNLSDLAAMGAAPRAALVALTLCPTVRLAWLEHFHRGLAATARAHRLHVIGGDIAQTPGALAASLTLIGHAAAPRMLTRAGARIGDHIYTTGTLGGSILGKHHRFTPRLAEGAWLAARPEVLSMMDISDGIAKDLRALTPPRARPALTAAAIPISPAARKLAAATGARTPLAHALCDGEDYELLLTLSAQTNLPALETKWRARFPRLPLTRIGRFVPEDTPLAPTDVPLHTLRGYEHLAP
jgi:thiamine-monophosphate kinase